MFAASDWPALLQVSQQAAGQEAAGRDRLGVCQQEQPIRRETGDTESAHPLPTGDAQSVSVRSSHQVKSCSGSSSTLNVVAGGICSVLSLRIVQPEEVLDHLTDALSFCPSSKATSSAYSTADLVITV